MQGIKLVQSVSRALDILQLISVAPAGANLDSLCRISGLKKPTVHNLLRTLVAKKYLLKFRRPIRYRIGPAAMSLGYVRHLPQDEALYRRAGAILLSVAGGTNSSVNLETCRGGEIIAVMRAVPRQTGILEMPSLWPIPGYGSGVLFQAYWGREQLQEYRSRHPLIKNSVLWKSQTQLNHYLSDARKRGYAVLTKRFGNETFRVMAPIFGADQAIQAVISLARPLSQTPPAMQKKCVEAIRKAAAELSWKP